MQKATINLILFLISCLFVVHFAWAGQAVVLNVQNAIGPATQDYVVRGLQQAKQQQAEVVVVQLNTPGGLVKSTRKINSAIIASSVPVISFVAPSGAHAASAGTFILYASHLAAMAPGTNIGAASPVALGAPKKDKLEAEEASASTMQQKAFNDAKAYIRSLAQMHGRNVKWAEKAVSEAATLTAKEALKQNVINVIAYDVPNLLNEVNGKTVTIQNVKRVLHTKQLTIKEITPDWRTQFLGIITDPSVAYILLLVGIYGLFFEFANPGFVVPGVAGIICLLLALYAFQMLPINYVGLGLLVAGITFMVMEAFVPSFGALGIGGVIAFAVGSIMLIDTQYTAFKIGLPIVVAVTGVTAAFFLLVVNMALRARFRPVVSGREELKDAVGEIISSEGYDGRMRLRGEVWQVKSQENLQVGDKVKVCARKGLILVVAKT